MAYKVFQNGTALTAEVMNDFIQEQTIARFANAAERNTAIPNPEVGQHCYLTSTNQTLRYEGSGWVEIMSTSLGGLIQRPIVVCTSTTRPAHAAGRQIFETDTSTIYVSNGSAWVVVFQDTGWISLTPNSYWTPLTGNFERTAYRIRNGECHFVLGLSRGSNGMWTGGQPIITLPANARPSGVVLWWIGTFGGVFNEFRCGPDGIVNMGSANIANGVVGTASFPIG